MKLLRTLLCAPVLLAALPAQAAVFFSEYVEGSSNNKALEIYNSGSTPVDLAAGGYKVAIYFNGNTTATGNIALSGTIPAGGVFVLANSSASAAVTAVANQTSGSLTFNGDDAIALVDSSGTLDVIGQIGVDPGSEWGSGLTSTADNTLRRMDSVTSGDPDGSDAFDPAVQWVGFATDTFDGLGCAGVSACGGSVGNDHRIYEIQGSAQISPLNGQQVTNVPGIVTAVAATGFYMQDGDGDGDPATSDGIFVYTGSAPSVSVGDEVKVDATVSEYRPGGSNSNNLSITELNNPTVTPASNLFSNNSIAPVIIGNGGRVPPNQIIDNDTSGSVEVAAQTTYDPNQDGIDFYESLEGMLVQVNDARVIAPTNSYGEIWVLGDAGANASGTNARGGITLIDDGDSIDSNPERILVDLSGLTSDYPQTQVGDTTPQITGVMSYGFYNFRILPTSLPVFTAGGLSPQTESLDESAGAAALSIGSYNLENFDVNDGDTCDGAPDQDVASGRMARLAQHIATNLQAPAILAVEEVQDNDGCTDDGVVDATTTLDTLVQAIVDAGGPHYSYVQINPQNDADGGIPGGNIRQAILYDPGRASFVAGAQGAGDATTATAPELEDGKLALSYSPGRIAPTDSAWSSSRKPLAATFDVNGRRLLVIANHFNSKGGDQPLFGRYQPPTLSSATQRSQQAQLVHDFVANALSLDPGARIVVLGDLNDFSWSTPLRTLDGQAQGTAILSDLSTLLLPDAERYSYVYEGNSQELDHLYVTQALLPDAQYQAVHVNSEFEDQASDHDPLLAVLSLPANQPPTVDAGAAQQVRPGAAVNLSGTASDSDGSITSYQWKQTGGPSVALSDATAASVSFTAPQVNAATALSFSLTATDNDGAAASDSVIINVVPNQAPVASAGVDQTVRPRRLVVLDGSASYDPDGSIAAYHWQQVYGPAVTLNNADQAQASFDAPLRPNTVLVFTLTVTDNEGAVSSDSSGARVRILAR